LSTFVVNNEKLLIAKEKNIYDRINLSKAAQQDGLLLLFWTYQAAPRPIDACVRSFIKSYIA
jgi:hypothetical protein